MFTIIGGDNKPYGPSTTEEIREWLKQGRADGRTLAQKDGGVWQPLALFPEFADLFNVPGALPKPPNTPLTSAELLARDYDLDILNCLTRSWELLQRNFWPVLGISILVFVANAVANNAIEMISGPPDWQKMFTPHPVTARETITEVINMVADRIIEALFIGGMFRYFLKLIRGEDAGLSDAFSGFSIAPGRLALAGFLTSVLMMLGLALCIVPGIYVWVGWFFTVPLIIDRQMDVWSAMNLSLRMASKHWFMVLGLILFSDLVLVCGLCALCIGIPLYSLMLAYAYEDIFGPRAR